MLHSYTILTFVVLFIYVRYLLVMAWRGTALVRYPGLLSIFVKTALVRYPGLLSIFVKYSILRSLQENY